MLCADRRIGLCVICRQEYVKFFSFLIHSSSKFFFLLEVLPFS